MQALKKIAVSIGDLNGIGFEIILKAHEQIKMLCEPVYCINDTMAQQAAALLKTKIPDDFKMIPVAGEFTIAAGEVCASSGKYSFDSFACAIDLARSKAVDAIVTLPIHKEAWMMAGIDYKGHTDALRDIFNQEAIMMLGCEKMYVALFTEHIPLKEVMNHMNAKELSDFMLRFYQSMRVKNIAVLGLNPHAGDNGVLGDEETEIKKAITAVNTQLGENIFVGPLVPDVAFTPRVREQFGHYIAMYHDQGLAPLKALYFDEGINVSLGLPIIRTSVDHGTAFDIAYQNKVLILSYINAIKAAISLIKNNHV
ncbi:MAG: 4-hydroxythreonine-4-phosphate dehydrogenase [Sulfuricurvum sp.]|nr:4-hydroxythreonine-4-phosphate dehydrogenase [Sulfuricurvum sp.]MDP3022040.1 4-hydroxythreonine-4-phosphate dehydrogenase [Sulfuricurvum sp.]MDP3120406.1 4-hydroxythreonine-4-phosphate dehydrogenase [Sulfuricurvum sp.]